MLLKPVCLLHLEKNKTTVQKQWTQNNSSNLELWVWITWGFLFSVRYSTLYIIKKNEKLTTSRSIHIYINRINNTLVFKIKDGYKLDLQTPKTIKLFGSTKKINRQDKGWCLEMVEVVLVQYNLVDD